MAQGNLKIIGFLLGGALLGSLVTFGITQAQQKKAPVDVSSAIGKPFVKVDGKVYTTAELPGDSAMEYYMLEKNIYNARQTFASQLAIRIALAKDAQKPINSTSLPKLEDLMPLTPVSDAEAKQYYDNLVAQRGVGVFGGQSFEQIKAQLEERINQQRASDMISKKSQELKEKKRFETLLPIPVAPSVSLDLAHYPSRGNPNSSMTLVEVADYLCPHCREAEPVMENLYKEYKDKIKFVHVSFPLAPSGLSGALARGAFCANQQGQEQFWKYHAAAYQVPWDKMQAPSQKTGLSYSLNQTPEAYFNSVASDIAQNVKLDVSSFNTCLTSTAAADYIKNIGKSFNESKGFQGTPTFYLNNKIVIASPEQLESTLRVALEK